jgi:hypothetical protein
MRRGAIECFSFGTWTAGTVATADARKLTWSSPFGICGEDVILGGCQRVACGSALRVLRLWRPAGHGGWLEPGRGVIVEYGISPSVRVRESLVVLLNQLDLDEVTATVSGVLAEKGGVVNFSAATQSWQFWSRRGRACHCREHPACMRRSSRDSPG